MAVEPIEMSSAKSFAEPQQSNIELSSDVLNNSALIDCLSSLCNSEGKSAAKIERKSGAQVRRDLAEIAEDKDEDELACSAYLDYTFEDRLFVVKDKKVMSKRETLLYLTLVEENNSNDAMLSQ